MPLHDSNKKPARKGEVLVTLDDQTVAIQSSSLKAYQRRGWTLVDDRSSESAFEETSSEAGNEGSLDEDDLEDKEQ
jgi:hypothetical protein